MSDIQTISHNNYILQGPGGGEIPKSVSAATDYVTATSGDINSTIDNVSSNSGVWGGSALPISAGPGIKFSMVDNTLVASTDETVLYSGNLTGNGSTAQLSEPITNFERIKVYGHTDDGIYCTWFTEFYPAAEQTTDVGVATNNRGWAKWFNFTITTGGLYTNVTGRVLTFGTTTDWGNLDYYGMTRVIGINRIAGGN